MDAEQHELIGQLYIELFEMLNSYALSALHEKALAEEAVQETFQIACQKPEQLLKSPNPRGWLVNTLKFTVCNMKRKRDNARQLLSRYLIAQTADAAFSEDKVSLEVLYENVSDTEEFKLIKEMAVDGRSHLELAAARGISLSACKKRVQRAKERLQKKINI